MIKLRYTSILYHIVLHIMSSQAILQDSNVPATGDMLCVPGLGAPGCMKTGASATRCTYIPIYICAYLHTYIHSYLLHTYRYTNAYIQTLACRHVRRAGSHMPRQSHAATPSRPASETSLRPTDRRICIPDLKLRSGFPWVQAQHRSCFFVFFEAKSHWMAWPHAQSSSRS